MTSSSRLVDHMAPPALVLINRRDFRTITFVCESACRHYSSEILFTLLVDKRTRQVQEIHIPKQTASSAHCDALPGEDLRIADYAVEHGWAIYKAHSHGRSFNFSSADDYDCATSLHATCAANAVQHRIELPVHVEDRHIHLGSARSVELIVSENTLPKLDGGVRAYAHQTIGESAFYTFNAHGDQPRGVGLRLVTHPATDQVTAHIVEAKVEIRKGLARQLGHWTRDQIDAAIDAKLHHPDGTLYAERAVSLRLPAEPDGTDALKNGAATTQDSPSVSVCIDSGQESKTIIVLPVDTFHNTLSRVLEHDDSGILKRILDDLPGTSAIEETTKAVES